LGERLAIRVPRTYNCVVPLAVRKTLRTVLDACLQLPENPDLPRWFQAKMTFQVNLSDTKRAQTFNIDRSLLHRFKLKYLSARVSIALPELYNNFRAQQVEFSNKIFMSFQPTWPRDVPELAGDVRQCTEGCNAGPLLGIFPQLWASDFHGWHMNGI
jgi:hypothetical protein